jgi:hypothetical protein
LKHAIFISIDIEGGHRSSHTIHKVGVSILNTKDLPHHCTLSIQSPNPI